AARGSCVESRAHARARSYAAAQKQIEAEIPRGREAEDVSDSCLRSLRHKCTQSILGLSAPRSLGRYCCKSSAEREIEIHDRAPPLPLRIDHLDRRRHALALGLEHLEEAHRPVVVADARKLRGA